MSQPMIWAVDFGAETVTVLAAECKTSGSAVLAGSAQVPAQGIRRGEFVHAGDVTECLVAALREAEKSCGRRCSAVYYNFDDVQMESHFPVGSRTLAGEGQIRPADVEQAVVSAGRFVSHFEKSAVYSRPVSFMIDGKDSVTNPVGVFGRQLDVGLHVLLARAQRLENWQRVMERARLQRSVPVLSALSSVVGVLDAAERERQSVVCDVGGDLVSAVAVERGTLQEYDGRDAHGMSAAETAQWIASVCQKFTAKHGKPEEIVLTGDEASKESLAARVREIVRGNVRVGAPSGFSPFDGPAHAAAAGLLRVGAELRSHGPMARAQKNPIDSLRQRAVMLINEYF